MKRKSTYTLALGFTSFSLWAAVPALTVSYNNVAEGDFSAKLTWEGAASVERRIGTYGVWEPLAADQNGSYNDTSAKAGVRYCYRLVDAGEAGVAQEFRPLRKLPTTEQMVVSWGDFSSQGWCKPAANAFNGDTGRDSYPDATTSNPQLGIDFGTADRHVGYVRLYPRATDNCQGRLNGTAVYGFSGSWDGANENSGTKLSESLSDVSEVAWYALAVEGSTAYPIYYIQGAYGGNVNECEFYGWTDEDAAQEGPDEPPSGPVEPADAELTLKSVLGAVAENFEPTLSWTVVNCPLTVQRKIGEDAWEVIGTVVANGRSFTDTTAPVGCVCTYRLQAGADETAVANYSNEMTNRRVRRLTIPNDEEHIFWGGRVGDGWYKAATNAFDGDVNTWPDLGGTPKICVDFGIPTHVVAFVRVASRHADGCGHRLSGFKLYGSQRDGATEIADSVSGTQLTDPVNNVPDGGTQWYERTVASPAAYRSYYFAVENGNAAEVELYGWTLADVGEVYVPPLRVAANSTTLGGADYSAHLTWDAVGASVTLQRAKSATGPWTDLMSTEAAGDFVDESAACGVLYHYRLKVENSVSESVTYRRLKKLDTTACSFYWQGTADWGAEHTGDQAFDGDTATFPDLNYANPKVIVDFGLQTVTVAKVHLYPRTSYDPGRLNGATLYGSDKTGAEEKDTNDLATALTDALSYNQGAVWYELTVAEEKLAPHRTFYLKGNANGNVGECQLYGWTEDDLPKEPKGLILIFNGTKEN